MIFYFPDMFGIGFRKMTWSSAYKADFRSFSFKLLPSLPPPIFRLFAVDLRRERSKADLVVSVTSKDELALFAVDLLRLNAISKKNNT